MGCTEASLNNVSIDSLISQTMINLDNTRMFHGNSYLEGIMKKRGLTFIYSRYCNLIYTIFIKYISFLSNKRYFVDLITVM